VVERVADGGGDEMAHGEPRTAPLRVTVDASGPAAVITVGGDLDHPCADTLRDALDDVLRAGPASVTVDVAGLTFIDSSGLAVLVHAWRAGLAAGVPVGLRDEPAFLLTILDFTGIGEILARPFHRASNAPGVATA
jgi:anti-sigma B factor antagonist